MKIPLHKAPSRTVEYPDGSIVTISEAAMWNSMTVRLHGMPLVGDPVPHSVVRNVLDPLPTQVHQDEPAQTKPIEPPKKKAAPEAVAPIVEPKSPKRGKGKPTNQGSLF